MSDAVNTDAEDARAEDSRSDRGAASDEPQPEATRTDHPTGEDQAAQNRETESPA